MSHQTEKINRVIEIIKRNQKRILELKNTELKFEGNNVSRGTQ